jgi:hypothetical protein
VSVQLNHTIVPRRDQQRPAAFPSQIPGSPPPTRLAHFPVAGPGNAVSLHPAEPSAKIAAQHYAFPAGQDESDAAPGPIRDQGPTHWADPGKSPPGATSHHHRGHGLYFDDPDRHQLETTTRPHSSRGQILDRAILAAQ